MNRINIQFSKQATTYELAAKVQDYIGSELISLAESCDKKNKTGQPFHILELGCGVGMYTHKIQSKFPQSYITAIDFSKECIQMAQKKYLHPNTRYILADINEFVPSQDYNLITSNAALQWCPNLQDILTRMSSKINPGGKILLSLFGPKTFYELTEVISEKVSHPVSIPASMFIGSQAINRILKSVLSNIEISQQYIQVQYESVQELLKSINDTGVRGEGIRPKVKWTKGFLKKLEDCFQDRYGQVRVTYQVILVGGTKK